MRKNVGGTYETVGLIGSFRKHMDVINGVHGQLTENGFTVLAPEVRSKAVETGDFVLLESDVSSDPLYLESEYQKRLLESDIVYVCNVEGYIGGSAMMELGRLVGQSEVYFMEEPREPVIRRMAERAIYPIEELIRYMESHNDVFQWRQWWDAGLSTRHFDL